MKQGNYQDTNKIVLKIKNCLVGEGEIAENNGGLVQGRTEFIYLPKVEQ